MDLQLPLRTHETSSFKKKNLLKSSKLLNRTIILLTYNYNNMYIAICHYILPLCKLVRGPFGKTQTGPRTSQLAKRKLVRGPGSGFLDTAKKSTRICLVTDKVRICSAFTVCLSSHHLITKFVLEASCSHERFCYCVRFCSARMRIFRTK